MCTLHKATVGEGMLDKALNTLQAKEEEEDGRKKRRRKRRKRRVEEEGEED